MALFLAIDSGGTKTRCAVADETRVLAKTTTGSVKLTRVGEEEATKRLRAMLSEVASSAGVDLRDVTRTCAGLGGFGIDAVREWAERELKKAAGGDLVLCGDEEIALDGAFNGGTGILVVAGTGTIVMGRAVERATGEIHKFISGGWGHVLGDEGSGYWIGLEALRAGFWAKDRGVPTTLLEKIGEFWGGISLGEIVGKANGIPAPDFATLAPVVSKCAQDGDDLALSLLQRGGEELGDVVSIVAVKMREFTGGGEVGVAYTGSVLEHIAPVREAMARTLKGVAPEVRVLECAADALEGAIWRARNG
ncbi:N-acetylmuramic acid/N-acetylglucosamine kinase [Edaphobacter acidisoli]|uniref:N-acetylmuramic acid/N-acetylglucosamine kinase n=1 Tax=Edaphobacter acidisoli TaxID=2040573 RepID=A0A916W4N5_9BACT|nr:BadF/BadG/BcrA/BcrD ATPase family protein [Edaphobacter acidisoli]GGA65578.1 N-acetylmuramic acid/N-acetylglucosamine kinase [Edaphobacter acidisoli]